ncbi:hypothetical protein N2152v2_009301 [Parachlorella kessleri]
MHGEGTAKLNLAEQVAKDHQRIREAFKQLDSGLQVDWESLRGLYGLRLTPITWEELRQILADGSDEALATLGRSPQELKAYWEYTPQVINKQFVSVTDYLYCKVFSVPSQPGPDGRRVAVLPPDFNNLLRVVWRPNDFPYSFEPGMEHHNVWANRSLSKEELQQVIAENRRGYETQHYINPAATMSVPTVSLGLWLTMQFA